MQSKYVTPSKKTINKSRKKLLGTLIAYERQRQYPNMTITQFLKTTNSHCDNAVYSRLEHGIPVNSYHYSYFANQLGFFLSDDSLLPNIEQQYEQLLQHYFQDEAHYVFVLLQSFKEKLLFHQNDLDLQYHMLLIQTASVLFSGHTPSASVMVQLKAIAFLFDKYAKVLYVWITYQYYVLILHDMMQFHHIVQQLELSNCYKEHPVYTLIYAKLLITKDPLHARSLCHGVIQYSFTHQQVVLVMEGYALLSEIKYDFHSIYAELYNDMILEYMQFHPNHTLSLACAYRRKAFCCYTNNDYEESFHCFISMYIVNPLLIYHSFPYFAYVAQKCKKVTALLQITNRCMKMQLACMKIHMKYIQYIDYKLHHKNPTQLKHQLLAMCPFYFNGVYRSEWIVEIFEYEMDSLCQLRNSSLCKRKLTQAIHQYCKF